MKRLPILLITCLSLNASAQNWAPFPLDAGSQWRLSRGHLNYNDCWVHEDLVYYIDGDTTFNNNTYSKVYFTGTWWSQSSWNPNSACEIWPPQSFSGFKGLIREENGKYFDGNLGPDWEMYDFTLEEGDTLRNHYTDNQPYVVDSVDFVNVGGELRKRLIFDWTGNNTILIEGIGSNFGLFEPLFPMEFLESTFHCYGEDGIPLYPETSNCDFTVDLAEQTYDGFSISPNPSTGIFRIESPQKSTYCIYDLFGRIVKEGQLDGASEIDISSEPSGIYLLSVENEKGVSTAKLVRQ